MDVVDRYCDELPKVFFVNMLVLIKCYSVMIKILGCVYDLNLIQDCSEGGI